MLTDTAQLYGPPGIYELSCKTKVRMMTKIRHMQNDVRTQETGNIGGEKNGCYQVNRKTSLEVGSYQSEWGK